MAKKSPRRGDGSDYDVGRGKPPKQTQFKPGQSGNPGGRRKGSLNLRTVLSAVMESEIELVENGRRRKVPLVEALLKRQAQEALRGQIRALDSLLDRYERYSGQADERDEELPEEDRQVLEEARRRGWFGGLPGLAGEGDEPEDEHEAADETGETEGDDD